MRDSLFATENSSDTESESEGEEVNNELIKNVDEVRISHVIKC